MKSIPLFVVRLEGPFALGQSRVERLLDRVVSKFKQIDVALEVTEIHTEADICPELNTLALQRDRFHKLKAWAYAKAFTGPKRVCHVLGPGLKEDGLHYVAGHSIVGAFGSHSIAYSSAMRDIGEEKQWMPSIAAAVHEIGHYLGAGHRNGYLNVMHEDVLRYSTQTLQPWDGTSKKQIHKTLGV